MSEQDLRGWFLNCKKNLLEDGYDIENIPPQQIFNCDESGFALGAQDTGMTRVLTFFKFICHRRELINFFSY